MLRDHLLTLWKRLTFSQKPLQLGLFRSDYLLHESSSDPTARLELKQVEFNTISSSFGALSELAGKLHRYVLC
jgi:hypothetical protein